MNISLMIVHQQLLLFQTKLNIKKLISLISKKNFIKKIIFFENIENINEELSIKINDIFKKVTLIIKIFLI